MSDLTKLMADELRVRFDVLRPKMNVPARLVLAEISRRLERLEQCEATQGLLVWLLENPSCIPIETHHGQYIVQKYVGRTIARGNTKLEALIAARAALEEK